MAAATACQALEAADDAAGRRVGTEFQAPPREARPWVYWWFHGGRGDPGGMAKDIAFMKEKGIGGVLHTQTVGGDGVMMLSPTWDAWFAQALSLVSAADMQMGASVVDGWAMGGYWLKKIDAPKELVYSEMHVDGGRRLAHSLPAPTKRMDVYGEVAVLAFREDLPPPIRPQGVEATSEAVLHPARHAVDGDAGTDWRTEVPPAPGDPAYLDMRYASDLSAVGLVLAGMPGAGPASGSLLASHDGVLYHPVIAFAMAAGERLRLSFPVVKERYFRMQIDVAHAPDVRLAECQILQAGEDGTLRNGIMKFDMKSGGYGADGQDKEFYEDLDRENPEDHANDVNPSDVIDLTSRSKPDGTIDWEFPPGQWTVLRFGWTALRDVSRMSLSGGFEPDVLSPDRADVIMDVVGRRMREISVKSANGMPIAFHTDSSEIGASKTKGRQPTWTEDFRQQFIKRRGYDPLPYLPALARRIVTSRDRTNRFLWDYRATIADLVTAFYERLQQRAHELGGTTACESGYGSWPVPHINGLQVFGVTDLPMSEFWHPYGSFAWNTLNGCDAMRTAASAARINGRNLVLAETLTFDSKKVITTAPLDYRRTLHEAWARGLNKAVLHKYSHQKQDWKPGRIDFDIVNRHSSWAAMADGFTGYIARCQSILQQGQFVADAAFFIGEGSMRFVPGRSYIRPGLGNGYDYDGISAEILTGRARIEDGQLGLPGGPRYRYLILCEPQCSAMTATTLARMHELVEQGMTLIGRPPRLPAGLGPKESDEAEFERHRTALWGASPSKDGRRKVGDGRVFWGSEPAAVFTEDRLAPDVEATSAGNAVAITWIHRRAGYRDMYFLANPNAEPLEIEVRLRTQAASIELFDPADGSIRPLPQSVRLADGRTALPLRMEGTQGIFVVFGPSASDGALASTKLNVPILEDVVTLSEGPWHVSFDAAWVAPKPAGGTVDAGGRLAIDFNGLSDWRSHAEEGIRNYSGAATYERSFPWTGAAGDIFLDLGKAADIARIEVNGRTLATLWGPPWRVQIPDGVLHAGENALRITVANAWTNRLIADAALAQADRLTRCELSLYDVAVKTGRQCSGLIGPVALRRPK